MMFCLRKKQKNTPKKGQDKNGSKTKNQNKIKTEKNNNLKKKLAKQGTKKWWESAAGFSGASGGW